MTFFLMCLASLIESCKEVERFLLHI